MAEPKQQTLTVLQDTTGATIRVVTYDEEVLVPMMILDGAGVEILRDALTKWLEG